MSLRHLCSGYIYSDTNLIPRLFGTFRSLKDLYACRCSSYCRLSLLHVLLQIFLPAQYIIIQLLCCNALHPLMSYLAVSVFRSSKPCLVYRSRMSLPEVAPAYPVPRPDLPCIAIFARREASVRRRALRPA